MRKGEFEVIHVGMIVKYNPEYCSPGEEKYRHVVLENRMNPVTGKMTRWLIRTINSLATLQPTEGVEEAMIQPEDKEEE